MKPIALAAVFFACFVHLASAGAAPQEGAGAPEADVDIGADVDEKDVIAASPELANFCFLAGNPPADSKYAVIRRLKVGKGTYGGVRDVLPKLASSAKRRGADAIIGYEGSQRFGFFPWRMVRPVVRGTAIRWTASKPENCAAVGGSTLREIMESDVPPSTEPGERQPDPKAGS